MFNSYAVKITMLDMNELEEIPVQGKRKSAGANKKNVQTTVYV